MVTYMIPVTLEGQMILFRTALHNQPGTGNLTEMKRNKSRALCCGGEVLKCSRKQKGEKEVFIERTEEALRTIADIIALLSFCMTMLTDGLKYKNRRMKSGTLI